MIRTLDIPDAWLMGYMQNHPEATVADAVGYWLVQEQLAEQFDRERQHERD